jgi:adenosyl cobinamide kinase/adenosyl cobinamide phosphate guanylyltransferase
VFNRLIIGPNNSGKSVMAEEMLERAFKTIGYFATLPNANQYRAKIDEHQSRRGVAWLLYEATAIPDRDIEGLIQLFEQSDAVLIDGLSIFLQRSFFSYSNAAVTSYEQYISFLLNFESTIKHNNWIIVDTLHSLEDESLVVSACLMLQEQIKNIINDTTKVLLMGKRS